MPEGRVQFKETLEIALKRAAFVKTNLKIELFYTQSKKAMLEFKATQKENTGNPL